MGSVGFCGYSDRNPVGMGWGWVLKFHSHGNPAAPGCCFHPWLYYTNVVNIYNTLFVASVIFLLLFCQLHTYQLGP